jgi:hypothetical protein
LDESEFDEEVSAVLQLERTIGSGEPRGVEAIVRATEITMQERRCTRNSAVEFLLDEAWLQNRSLRDIARQIVDICASKDRANR